MASHLVPYLLTQEYLRDLSWPPFVLIYIDGIVNTSLSPGSKISLYADDMMLFKIINSNADYIDLQNDIDGLNYWVTANHLTFSSSKCKYMIISRKKNSSHPPALKPGSSALDRVYSYRYFGLLLTSSLCWLEHINDIFVLKVRGWLAYCIGDL